MRNFQNWGIEFGKSAWNDPSEITSENWEGYTLLLKADNWDLGLWEFIFASEPSSLEANLKNIQITVLVITGENDRIIPANQSVRLSDELPNAHIVVIPQCGHLPHKECPLAVMEAINDFLLTNNPLLSLTTSGK